MSDNKQPDALDRLRRRPAPSATPTPVVKDTPLLNDEARKLLEEKSKAAAMATKRAAEAGAKKSLEAGKAALGKFNSWRHDRAEAKVKVEAPVEALAPMEGITPSEVAEALAEREAALPVAEAPPMAVAPSGEEITDTMAKDQLLGAANTLKALVEDEEEREVPEAERQWKWSVPGLKKVLDTADASGGEPSGMLVLDGMGCHPCRFSQSAPWMSAWLKLRQSWTSSEFRSQRVLRAPTTFLPGIASSCHSVKPSPTIRPGWRLCFTNVPTQPAMSPD